MSEKEIKKTDVAGKNVEDLTAEELAEIQGQGAGDVNGETITPTIIPISISFIGTATISIKKCGK